MYLSNEQVTSFQELYRKCFGKDINQQDAYEKGVKLVRLMELVYKPITIEEYETLVNHNSSKQN